MQIPLSTMFYTIYTLMVSLDVYAMWDMQFQNGPVIFFGITSGLVLVAYKVNTVLRHRQIARYRREKSFLSYFHKPTKAKKRKGPVKLIGEQRKATHDGFSWQARHITDPGYISTPPVEIFVPLRTRGGVFDLPFIFENAPLETNSPNQH